MMIPTMEDMSVMGSLAEIQSHTVFLSTSLKVCEVLIYMLLKATRGSFWCTLPWHYLLTSNPKFKVLHILNVTSRWKMEESEKLYFRNEIFNYYEKINRKIFKTCGFLSKSGWNTQWDSPYISICQRFYNRAKPAMSFLFMMKKHF